MDEEFSWMSDRKSAERAERSARSWARAVALLTGAWLGCAGLTVAPPADNIDRVSRSGEAFFDFLQSRGRTIEEIRALMPDARIDSLYLIDEKVTNEELGEYIQLEASEYPFEIFLRVTVSTEDQHVYRYLVKGDWRSVKMGYGSLSNPEFYDAIYLHTHPRGKRILPNSLSDYLHAESLTTASRLLVGDGIPIEFESAARNKSGVDYFEIDDRSFSLKRPEQKRLRSKEQRRRNHSDADDAVRELDRIFRENVEAGCERIALRNSEGMLVTYERSRALSQRLDEVYRAAGIGLPEGAGGVAVQSDIPPAVDPKKTRPLGL